MESCSFTYSNGEALYTVTFYIQHVKVLWQLRLQNTSIVCLCITCISDLDMHSRLVNMCMQTTKLPHGDWLINADHIFWYLINVLTLELKRRLERWFQCLVSIPLCSFLSSVCTAFSKVGAVLAIASPLIHNNNILAHVSSSSDVESL